MSKIIGSSGVRRGLAGAAVFTLFALVGCEEPFMPLEPPPEDPVGPVAPGKLTATITGDITVSFEGGGIASFGEQGFRLRSPGTGQSGGHFMELREFDRVDGIDPGTYAIVEAWSYFEPGFTVTFTRPLPQGRQQYAAIEGVIEVTEVTHSVVIGTFTFRGAQTYECLQVQGVMECDPVTGADRRQIEVSGQFEAVR